MQSPRRSRLTEADKELWASYASRIRPLPGRRPPALPRVQDPAPLPRPAPLSVPRSLRGGPSKLGPLDIGTAPGGVDSATWHRFRTGRLAAARTLDLHGYTAQRAFHALTGFLRVAQAEGMRCVEVVTGQGGVLRRELPMWLNQPELRGLVLGAAHPHAANPGAVRLLLRRLR